VEEEIESLVSKLIPASKEITLGAVFGFCSGYYSKKMAEKAVYVVGGTFVAL
jgi:uncharacterized membrane protein (Fun14 family)